MTPEEILEGNKLMAEFLGWKQSPNNPDIWQPNWDDEISSKIAMTGPYQEGLYFHKDWNSLMGVIEKMNNTTKWEEWDIGYLSVLLVSAHLPEVYDECLKFIKSLNDERN